MKILAPPRREREREREQNLPKCSKCQREPSKGRTRLVTNICIYCHKWGDNKQYCEECFRAIGPNGEINPNEDCPNRQLQEHQDKCKQSEKVKKDIQAGYWNCQVCKENLWEKESWSPNCSCPIGKHFYIRLCCDKHSEEEIDQLMVKIHQKNQVKSDKKVEKETEKLEPNQIIYYTCPHNEKMTEPNCKICLSEAEEELKRIQEEKTYKEECKKKAEEEAKRTGLTPFLQIDDAIVNHQSLTGSSTVDFCPKCGIALKSLHGNAYLYRHQGIETQMAKQIETKHCQPEQIAQYQKKLKENSESQSKLKGLIENLTYEDKEAMEKTKQTQEREQQRLQKQRNFILGGILVSLVILVGMGIYLVMKNKKGGKE